MQRYLVNYNEGDRKDPNYYTGSMLAAHFSLLDKTKQRALMETARAKLVNPKVGVYNAFHGLRPQGSGRSSSSTATRQGTATSTCSYMFRQPYRPGRRIRYRCRRCGLVVPTRVGEDHAGK